MGGLVDWWMDGRMDGWVEPGWMNSDSGTKLRCVHGNPAVLHRPQRLTAPVKENNNSSKTDVAPWCYKWTDWDEIDVRTGVSILLTLESRAPIQ